jgi:large subunit ribosomal protein L21
MYAVIITGGKQYKVSEGDTLKVEKLDVEAGKSIDFNDVLMIGNDDDVTIGTPLIAKAKVKATIVSHGRGKKIKIIKFKRRKHHMKRMGHRQSYTEIEITGIAA